MASKRPCCIVGWLVMMVVVVVVDGDWGNLNLPYQHAVNHLHSRTSKVRQQCLQDPDCPYKAALQFPEAQCWGYEADCPQAPRMPRCPEDSRRWTKDKAGQVTQFWNTADFGYVKQRRDELKAYCKPQKSGDSSLHCVDHLRFCQASNVFVDLTTAGLATATNPYREDVLKRGQIGGKCRLDRTALTAQLDHKSPLQSWASEMEHFVSVSESPLTSKRCDVIITKPTLIIKLDATVNMYHHFCDYVNLYISQHLNGSFSTDVNVFIWDTSGHLMSTMFTGMWKAFSDHAPLRLNQYDGKTVCFKQAVFSFLARMRSGLYYNMPLIPGCQGSRLMKAFSHHVIHRLNIPQHGPLQNKIRVTLLSRSTKYRQILNQDELVRALRTDFEFEVRTVDFIRTMPFLEQIEISHNSDIFIGMHGAGLTHMLLQPDWAVVIELYNCEDRDCYHDLARLRGVHYMTWENKKKLHQEDEGHHPTLGAHAKFTNYAFDVDEFMRLMRKAADYVRSHPEFAAARHRLYTETSKTSSSSSSSSPRVVEANASQLDKAELKFAGSAAERSSNGKHQTHTEL